MARHAAEDRDVETVIEGLAGVIDGLVIQKVQIFGVEFDVAFEHSYGMSFNLNWSELDDTYSQRLKYWANSYCPDTSLVDLSSMVTTKLIASISFAGMYTKGRQSSLLNLDRLEKVIWMTIDRERNIKFRSNNVQASLDALDEGDKLALLLKCVVDLVCQCTKVWVVRIDEATSISLNRLVKIEHDDTHVGIIKKDDFEMPLSELFCDGRLVISKFNDLCLAVTGKAVEDWVLGGFQDE